MSEAKQKPRVENEDTWLSKLKIHFKTEAQAFV